MSIALHAAAPSTGIWLQAYPGLGVPALVIASGGTHGPSHLLNDLSLPADADKEYRFAIVTPPASCALALYPDGSYIATPPPGTVNLTDSFVYRLLEDGADLGTATQIIVIGAGTAGSYTATMAALAAGSTYAGGAATYTAPGGAPAYTATMAALVAGSAYAGGAAVYAAPYVETAMEPVTVAEAKLAARVDGTELDAVIAGYISTARQMAEHETGREYVAKTKRYTFTDWPAAGHVMHVHQPTAVAVQHWDGAGWVTLTSGSGFAWGEVDQGVGIAPPLGQAWPALGAIAIGPRVRVDVTAGSATPTTTTPECIKTFIKAAVAFWVDNPTEGASGSLSEAPRLGRLLDPERLWGA